MSPKPEIPTPAPARRRSSRARREERRKSRGIVTWIVVGVSLSVVKVGRKHGDAILSWFGRHGDEVVDSSRRWTDDLAEAGREAGEIGVWQSVAEGLDVAQIGMSIAELADGEEGDWASAEWSTDPEELRAELRAGLASDIAEYREESLRKLQGERALVGEFLPELQALSKDDPRSNLRILAMALLRAHSREAGAAGAKPTSGAGTD